MIKIIVHSGDWQTNSNSTHITNAINYAKEQYFLYLNELLLKYKKEEILQIIPGDLFDRKEKSSITDYLWVKNFLEKCCEYSQTIITLGNHDFDTRHRHMPTLLRLLVDNSNIEGLTFYEKSGVYEYNDEIRFFVFSNLEKSKKPEDFKQHLKGDKLNVGLYHDPLSNAKDYNPKVKYTKYPNASTLFKGLDCVIMADIHKRQIISIDGKANAIYCGSPYQRTFGEDVLNHGIVKWELPSFNYEFIDLENPFNLIKLETNIKDKKINILN